MKRMVVIDDIHLYLMNDQTGWCDQERRPKSFVLEQCIGSAPWSLHYRRSDGEVIQLDPLQGPDEIRRDFSRLKRQCRSVIKDRRPEMVNRVCFTEANYTAANIVSKIVRDVPRVNLSDRVFVCTRTSFSEITSYASNIQIYVVLEDQQIPCAVYYINANEAKTYLHIGDIPGLDLALARLPPHFLISKLDYEQLSPLRSCFENYLTKLVPMPVCKRLTNDILKSFKLTNVAQNMLLQRLYSLGAECDWGVESGVIVDVLIQFLILLHKTLSKFSNDELKACQNRALLFDILVGVLVVSCKLAADISVIQNSEFAMRSDADGLDAQRVNHMELVVISRNQYSFWMTETELKQVADRLDSQRKKHANSRGSRYQLWFKSASQSQENGHELKGMPKRIEGRK